MTPSDKLSPSPKAQKSHGLSRRGAARLMAVQALYQYEMNGGSIDKLVVEFLTHRVEEEQDGLSLKDLDRDLFAVLAKGVAREKDHLDDMLSAVLSDDWPVERLERLLRVILRAGTFELSEMPETPARVIITEYMTIAESFFLGKEPGLANGVLDRLARTLRPEEFSETGGGDVSDPDAVDPDGAG